MGYLLGIDIGSGGCKVTLLESKKGSACTVSEEYPVYYPAPGWAEQDAGDWIKACAAAIGKTLAKEGIDSAQIQAVAVGGVTHSPVLLDKAGQVLGKVMHITDTRSYRQAQELSEGFGQKILDTACNPVEAMWTLPMLLWVRQQDKQRFHQIKKILFPKDYIRYRLTGTDCTDRIEAEGTLFYSPSRKEWDLDLFDLTGLDQDVLPRILPPAQVAGKVTPNGASWSGLKEGTPVMVGSTDTMLEVFAAGASSPGDCTVKLATFGRICVITDQPFSGKGLINYSYIKPGLFYPGTGTKSFAASLRWCRDQCCRDMKDKDAYRIMDREAENIAAGANGLIFHPYLQGEGSPYNDPGLKGDFLGLSLHHTRAHLVRAVLEGTAASLKDSMEFLKEKGMKIKGEVRFIGGGSASSLWTQIVADMLGTDAVIPQYRDASLGTALLAGMGIGAYSTYEEAQRGVFKILRKVRHNKENHKIYKQFFSVYKMSQKKCQDIYHHKGYRRLAQKGEGENNASQ